MTISDDKIGEVKMFMYLRFYLHKKKKNNELKK